MGMLDRLLTHAAANLDRAMAVAATRILARGPAALLSHQERVAALRRVVELYGAPQHFHQPDTFFPRASVLPAVARVPSQHAPHVVEVTWPSRFEPYCAEVSERYLRRVENRTVHARLYSNGEPGRPALVLLHGYMCGQWALEERVWPLGAFVNWGLDVAILALPFHGERAAGGFGAPAFPSSDPRFTVEGFRQAIQDLRGLVAFLRQRGAPQVGLMGMSLGGYTAALACTLDPYDFLVPMIPLGSLADFARDGGQLGSQPEQRHEQHRHLEAAYAVVSPLSRRPAIASHHALVVTGRGDRITPTHHARRLANHFGARLHTFHGGHLLQFGRGHAFRDVRHLLQRLAVIR
jgi:pimeloyl-ACP methyl ester carboxylesterase